jgi:AcrR family transcriptional regulator
MQVSDRRAERHASKRDAILAEAWSLARRDGVAGISLRDLADAVGLRQPSLYVYFGSKLDLYDAMFADANRQLLEFVRARRYDGEPVAALGRLLADCVQFGSDDVERSQLLFNRPIPGFEPSPESYALAVEFYEFGRGLMHAAGLRTQDDLDLFTALAAGLTHQQVANDPGGRRWVRLCRRAVEMLVADVRRRDSDPSRGGTP